MKRQAELAQRLHDAKDEGLTSAEVAAKFAVEVPELAEAPELVDKLLDAYPKRPDEWSRWKFTLGFVARTKSRRPVNEESK